MFESYDKVLSELDELKCKYNALQSNYYEIMNLFQALKTALGYELVENENRERWILRKKEN